MPYSDFGDMPGCCVVYKESGGNFINIVNIGNGYIARYRDTEKGKACSATVKIVKGFNTAVELIEVNEGTEEDFENIIKPKITNLFFYTDMNMRNNLPKSFVTTRKDLFSGNITRSGLVDFFIPITNLIWEKDENDSVITKCIQFGLLSPDEVNYFLNSADIPEPEVRENLKDFYAYIMRDILSITMNACVVSDSFEMKKIGKAICVTYDVITYQYWELNTIKLCLFSDDGENFDVLRINGYSSFIEKNIDMINQIIESAKVIK